MPQCALHADRIHTVNTKPRHAIRRRHLTQLRRRAALGPRSGHGILVILDHVDDRRLPKRGQIAGLVYRPLIHRAVTVKTQGDELAPQHLVGPGHTGGRWNASTHNRVGAGHADVGIVKMHRTAATAAAPFGKTHDLFHQCQNVRLHRVGETIAQGIVAARRTGAERLGQILVVRPVRAAELVLTPDSQRRPHRHRLLPHAGMDRTVDQIRVLERQQFLLERPDQRHLLVHPEQFPARQFGPIIVTGRQLQQRRCYLQALLFHR